jgi:hypothetical protein
MVVAVVAAEAMGTMWVEETTVVLIGMMYSAQMVGGGEERIHPVVVRTAGHTFHSVWSTPLMESSLVTTES